MLDFLIIGAQKSATTLLQRCLAEHPSVYMPRDEIPYFEDPHYAQGPGALTHRFAEAEPGQLLGLKRPDYLGRPECPPRIFQTAPNAKLILVLRDPLDRAISGYFHYLHQGTIPLKPVQRGLRDLLDGAVDDAYPQADHVLDYGRYGEHLTRYLKYFPTSQILVFLYEEVSEDVRSVVKRAYSFLDIDPTYRPAVLDGKFHLRPQAVVYSYPRVRFLRSLAPWTVRFRKGRERRWARPLYLVVRGIDQFILAPALGNRRPVISDDLESELRDYFRSDIEQVARLTGKDLGGWL